MVRRVRGKGGRGEDAGGRRADESPGTWTHLPSPGSPGMGQAWCRGTGRAASLARATLGDATIIGISPQARELRHRIREAARLGTPVFVSGETGTGKEVVARAIHCQTWSDPAAALVVLGCGTLPVGCLCKVLHIRGGNTCDDCRAAHLREGTARGTLLLDEVSELEPTSQMALLAFLDSEADADRPMVVVATSNQDLRSRVLQGAFHRDLHVRLAASEIHVPPLRERVEDIPIFLEYLIEEANRTFGTVVEGVAPDLMEAALSHLWPGNVRELRNAVFRSVLLTESGVLRELALDGHESDLADI
jgi:DNA-binding NtrC family response regulator